MKERHNPQSWRLRQGEEAMDGSPLNNERRLGLSLHCNCASFRQKSLSDVESRVIIGTSHCPLVDRLERGEILAAEDAPARLGTLPMLKGRKPLAVV